MQLGTYQVASDLSDAQAGSSRKNDQTLFIGRLKLKADQFNSSQDQVLFDFRDQYNYFGVVDPRILALDQANAAHLRELVYKRLFDGNKIYFSVGRFQTRELGVEANDGVEVGFNLSRFTRVGAVLGLLPSIYANRYRAHPKGKESIGRSQQGAYLIYDGGRISKTLSSFFTSNSIFNQNAPSLDGEGRRNMILLHHHGLASIYEKHRFFSLLDLESSTGFSIRRARASYHYISKNIRGNLFYYQNSGKYFSPSDPMKIILVPSGIRQVGVHGQYRINSSLSLKARIESGKRTIDSADHSEILLGAQISPLRKKSFTMSLMLGPRDHYSSSGMVYRFQSTYFNSKASLNFIYQRSDEKDESTGEDISPQLTSIGGDFYINDQNALTSYYSILDSSRQNTSAFYLGLIRRLGIQNGPPRRKRPARFGSLL